MKRGRGRSRTGLVGRVLDLNALNIQAQGFEARVDGQDQGRGEMRRGRDDARQLQAGFLHTPVCLCEWRGKEKEEGRDAFGDAAELGDERLSTEELAREATSLHELRLRGRDGVAEEQVELVEERGEFGVSGRGVDLELPVELVGEGVALAATVEEEVGEHVGRAALKAEAVDEHGQVAGELGVGSIAERLFKE